MYTKLPRLETRCWIEGTTKPKHGIGLCNHRNLDRVMSVDSNYLTAVEVVIARRCMTWIRYIYPYLSITFEFSVIPRFPFSDLIYVYLLLFIVLWYITMVICGETELMHICTRFYTAYR